jgi:hypothetical protein
VFSAAPREIRRCWIASQTPLSTKVRCFAARKSDNALRRREARPHVLQLPEALV